MKIHELKCLPIYFNALIQGRKRFEIRKNDRGFALGDLLHIQEYYLEQQRYSGRTCLVKIDYIIQGNKDLPFPLPDDYVVMSISRVNA